MKDQINREVPAVTAWLVPGQTAVQLVIQTTKQNEAQNLSVTTTARNLQNNASLSITQSHVPDFLVSLSQTDFDSFSAAGTKVIVRFPEGEVIELTESTPDGKPPLWRLYSDDLPLAVLEVSSAKKPCDLLTTKFKSAEFEKSCRAQFLLARHSAKNYLLVGMEVTPNNLKIAKELLDDPGSSYVVNGWTILDPDRGPFLIGSTSDAWHVGWYKKQDSCRQYVVGSVNHTSMDLWPEPNTPDTLPQNGIVVGAAKLFDVAALRKMLSDTATQLAAISGFNNASIVSAFGNLQGVTRDTSFFAAQVTTTPLPSVTSSLSNTAAGSTSTATSFSTPSTSTTTVTLQCPDGTVPSVGSGNVQGCAVPSANPPATSTSTLSTVGTTNAPNTTQQNVGSGTNVQSGTTSTLPSIVPTVPTAPASAPLTAPTNIGQASGDILAEQVQLNAQITTLRLLLQGALSDQYLLKNSRAVATRQQATLGFTVSLDPPRQFRHAVAEIRVIVIPPENQDPVSIMTLLPSEKTYNVAKVTSHQNAFGAGVAVQPVSVGVNTGKSKDRLYLAKDTDTLALQFPLPPPVTRPVERPFPQKLHDRFKSVVDFQDLSSCKGDDALNGIEANSKAVVFGWQFRPVLGADFVQGGQRQVFAQLALPTTVGQSYVPTVWVQTRWRAYDPKRQVVGAVYSASCYSRIDVGGIALVNTPQVRDVKVSDLGGGQLRLTATGQFYSSTMTVLEGAAPLTPVAIDGKKVELFANAHDLLEANDLLLIGQNGQNVPFAISVDEQKKGNGLCSIRQAELHASPYPDGNSRVELDVSLGSGYVMNGEFDGVPHHLVLAGSNVYGLRETPFTQESDPCQERTSTTPVHCRYSFIAPTTDLRNAQKFLVRDVTWEDMQASGTTVFAPSFTGLSILSADPSSSDNGKTTFALAGYDFGRIQLECNSSINRDRPYLQIFIGAKALSPSDIGFTIQSDNLATMFLNKEMLAGAKAVRFRLSGSPYGYPDQNAEWELPIPKADSTKIVASPAFLRVGDSETVSFSGRDFSTFSAKTDSVKFEDQAVALAAKYNPDSKSLEVIISTKVTSQAGHKELTLTMGGKAYQLSIDVFKQ